MKAVILAGGLGTRLREETEFKPKPMVEIGGMPILWHIMKNLSVQGINEFVICLGYKGEVIKDFFLNYYSRRNNLTVRISDNTIVGKIGTQNKENWEVTLVNTGLMTQTGGRIKRIEEFVRNEDFLCTYGDGLADLKLSELLKFHNSHTGIATVTSVNPPSRFGALEIDSSKKVTDFVEKPGETHWINGGFFIFKKEVFNYLDDECVLEGDPLRRLSHSGELFAYQHHGFWQPMDTYRETTELNKLYENNEAPWKNW
jgi:glucose-1-phosphate cytidylyltransferase